MSDGPDPNNIPGSLPPLAALPTARPISLPYASSWLDAWQRELDAQPRHFAALDLLLVFMTALLFNFLPQLLLTNMLEPPDLAPPPPVVLVLGKWCEAGLALGLLAYLVMRQGLPARVFGVTASQPWTQVAWGLAGLFGCYAAMLSTGVVVLVFFWLNPAWSEDLNKRFEFMKLLPTGNMLVELTLLVGVAIHEEIIFRGLLMPYLRRLTGAWWKALLISSLIFGALHIPGQGLLSGFQIFGVGCMLGLVFILSRSLLAPALAHLLFDFIQLRLMHFFVNHPEFTQQFGS